MPGPNATARTWYCDGCQKTHPLSRDIEGTRDARCWCAVSIIRGLRSGVNYLPPQAEHFRRNLSSYTRVK